jgi:hypothetical protein
MTGLPTVGGSFAGLSFLMRAELPLHFSPRACLWTVSAQVDTPLGGTIRCDHFLCHHFERFEDMRSKGLDHRHVTGVPSPGNGNTADAAHIVTGIECDPHSTEIDLEPGIEVHRLPVGRHTDVAEVAVDVACRDVQAAAQRDREMGEVPANANPLLVSLSAVRVQRACL